jgi:hypothetical protein
MISATRIRSGVFVCGIAGIIISMAVVVGSYLRPINTTDYIQQAEEAVPWVQSGFLSAMAGLVLCFFGKKWWRVAGVSVALLLLIWWFLIGESLV